MKKSKHVQYVENESIIVEAAMLWKSQYMYREWEYYSGGSYFMNSKIQLQLAEMVKKISSSGTDP